MGAWDFLPGRLWIERGCARDYMELARFHYCGGRPATWAGVWVGRYADGGLKEREGFNGQRAIGSGKSRVVAVGVLSWPTVRLRVRERHFGVEGLTGRERIAFANRNVRTISRVVVHPQFRGIGLASEMVHCLLYSCDTRYVEAIAAMGRMHPFFEKAGMRRVKDEDMRRDEWKAYFVWENPKYECRNSKQCRMQENK